MPWTPPDDYKPMPGVSVHLLSTLTPKVGTAEFKMVVMVTHNKTPAEVGLTPAQARTAIDEQIVPTGLYPSVLAVALSDQN
ncbi:MAG: hypothetical protein AAGC57_18335 [Pseudomonadota bacterium]